MALNAVEQVSEQVPADDFQALEEKVYRTIEMFKAAREGQANAERDAQRLRQQLEDREEELVRLRRETVQLKKDEGTTDPSALQGMLEAIDNGSTDSVYVMVVQDGADIAGMGGLMGTAMAATPLSSF